MSNVALADQPEYHTDLSVGEILRRTRLHYGQTLQQVEAILRIRATQLEAIELGDIERLPGRVYAIGFVRSYSEYLGLDGDKMVRLFKSQSIGSKISPELHFPVPASESKVPNLYTIVAALAGTILVVTVWAIFFSPKHAVEEIPPVPAEIKASLEPKSSMLTSSSTIMIDKQLPAQELLIEPSNGPAGEVEGPVLPERKGEIVFEISESTWVEIRNAEGAAVLRQVLKPGDKYTVPEGDGLVLSTGNAGGIKILIDGKEAPPLGKSAEVRRNIVLNAEALSKIVEN